MRLPFSRFHKIISWLFWCEDTIHWRGIIIKVNPGEIHSYYTYFLGAYATEEIDKLIEYCRNAYIFADVGANIGMVSLAIARACPNLEVFAFEPDRYAFMEFMANLNLNPDLSKRVHLVEKAVADINGNLYFRPSLDPMDIESGRVVSIKSESQAGYTVPSVRLDTFFENLGAYPDVVKIDVEGFELQALKGMDNLFNKGFPKAMLIEVHPLYFIQNVLIFETKIKTVIEQAGYNLFRLEGRNCKEWSPSADWQARFHIFAIKKE